MSSSEDSSPHASSEETLTIENIIGTLSNLLDCLPEVKRSIPECSSSLKSQFAKFEIGVKQIREVFHKLKTFKGVIGGSIKNLECDLNALNKISDIVAQDPNEEVQAKLSALNNNVTKLKFIIRSLPPKMTFKSSDTHLRNGFNSVAEPLILHSNHTLPSNVRELQDAFKNLDTQVKLCLLSFTVLPENVFVKRRLLIYWWVGECLVNSPANGKETAEDVADKILRELTVKCFIKSVTKVHKNVPDRFKMEHNEHSLVIRFAQKACDDINWNQTADPSTFNRACLMKAGEGTSEQLLATGSNLDQEKLRTIFNVNEPNPDLRFQQFSKMKNVNVLYLGRWQSSDAHDIEVQSTEFLKGLKNMKCLRLLSLQGIFEINKIPNSIEKLTNLRILDLKACHSLEALPDGIKLLKQLSHLDMSECYLLDRMPKGLASLSELQVLKGFVIGNLPSGEKSCTIEDLKNLKKLNKLSINTSSKTFPSISELLALKELNELQKLAIAWVYSGVNEMPDSVAAEQQNRQTRSNINDTEILLTRLEKLELKSFPHEGTPDWLRSGILENLKKLYIIGGKLRILNRLQERNEWNVDTLRLKYLKNFLMPWESLKELFPALIFLETVNCPQLESWPSYKPGVWQKLACQQ